VKVAVVTVVGTQSEASVVTEKYGSTLGLSLGSTQVVPVVSTNTTVVGIAWPLTVVTVAVVTVVSVQSVASVVTVESG
jgi:CDP-diglyceride synthetase